MLSGMCCSRYCIRSASVGPRCNGQRCSAGAARCSKRRVHMPSAVLMEHCNMCRVCMMERKRQPRARLQYDLSVSRVGR